MLKQYIYSAEQAGLQSWPSGELRLEGIEVTTDPASADIFVCPAALLNFQNDNDLDRFPYINGNEGRHVFFDISDHETIYTRRNCILMRCNLTTRMLAAHPNSLCIAWPVEDYESCLPLPFGVFVYDLSFRGWLYSDARRQSSNACKNNPDLKCDIEQYEDFTGYLHDRSTGEWTPEGIRRRAEFRRGMKESRIALCPESIPGHLPYRFFEAMSAGRVPLLVSSDYVLPFADLIPYDSFIIRCERDHAVNAGQVALDFIRLHSDTEIIEMGNMARRYWEMYLDTRIAAKTMAFAVTRKMKQLGLTTEDAALCA